MEKEGKTTFIFSQERVNALTIYGASVNKNKSADCQLPGVKRRAHELIPWCLDQSELSIAERTQQLAKTIPLPAGLGRILLNFQFELSQI